MGDVLRQTSLSLSPNHAALATGVYMDPRVALLTVFLSGCSALMPPYVEKSFRECLSANKSPTYTVTGDMKKVECK